MVFLHKDTDVTSGAYLHLLIMDNIEMNTGVVEQVESCLRPYK